MDYLNRQGAGFDETIWEQIDRVAAEAARSLLTARRFLSVEGPYGLGLTALETGEDDYCREPAPGEAGAVISRAISVPMLRKSFQLSLRRIEGHLRLGQPLQLTAIADAARAVAKREEEFIYHGHKEFGLQGLLNASEKSHFQGGDWSTTEQAINDVLGAVNMLDEAGFHGPYALVLSPTLYNMLFQRYEGTEMLQLEHLRRLCEAGVYKTDIPGGVVVDPRVGRLVIGQDLRAGYARQDGIHHQMYLSESLVLSIEQPRAICTLEIR